jgi:3-dehydroquinate synthetase
LISSSCQKVDNQGSRTESAKKIVCMFSIVGNSIAHGIDKDALWINFGGGSVSDVGGFVALHSNGNPHG